MAVESVCNRGDPPAYVVMCIILRFIMEVQMVNRGEWSRKIVGIALVGLLFSTGGLGCDRKQPAEDAKKEAPVAATEAIPAAEEAKSGMPAAGVDAPLISPASSLGRAANDEGVNHAQQGHWDVAEGHFKKALEADPKMAEAQFNLGLALDKLGKHGEATTAFKKALELAPTNLKIKESPILKKHTNT
jgi:tetratricopeptide (TPR) repeat protein